MLRPCLISWCSVVLVALPACERATPGASASAEPQQVSSPLLPPQSVPSPVPREQEVVQPLSGAAAGSAGALEGQQASRARGAGGAPSRSLTAEHEQKQQASNGAPSDTCVNGWSSPGRGNPLRKAALDMIRERKTERFVVEEMRYFRGPEDAEVISPQREVERWYVKAYSTGAGARRQRWLVRRAEVGRGVDAVAEFDSTGYAPGTWKRPDASDDSVSDPFQRPCDRQSAGEKCMGLPYAVLGCLDGT